MATNTTNGLDVYEVSPLQREKYREEPKSLHVYQQQPRLSPSDYSQRFNVILDDLPFPKDFGLPGVPTLPSLPGSYSVAEFFVLKDGFTGVLALGSFAADDFVKFGEKLSEGLLALKVAGATRLIVDVVSMLCQCLGARKY